MYFNHINIFKFKSSIHILQCVKHKPQCDRFGQTVQTRRDRSIYISVLLGRASKNRSDDLSYAKSYKNLKYSKTTGRAVGSGFGSPCVRVGGSAVGGSGVVGGAAAVSQRRVVGRQLGDESHGGSHDRGPSRVRGAVAQVLVARAAVFDAYVRRRVDGARAVVVAAVRRPRARPDDHQLSVHWPGRKTKTKKKQNKISQSTVMNNRRFVR